MRAAGQAGGLTAPARTGGWRPRRSRAVLAALAGAALVVALALGARALLSSGDAAQAAAWSPAAVAGALHRDLADRGLSVRGVQCTVPFGGAERYRGTEVLRCGANFGDPHMPVYRATLVSGELVTDRRVPGLRC
jgi:hypothetical protein